MTETPPRSTFSEARSSNRNASPSLVRMSMWKPACGGMYWTAGYSPSRSSALISSMLGSSKTEWFLGVAGLALLLTALYMVMPVGRLSFRHALAGGVTATILWEIVRRVLRWYFETLSTVNVVYGSLASTIGVLLTLEAAALVLLFGAQVIAELERSKKAKAS